MTSFPVEIQVLANPQPSVPGRLFGAVVTSKCDFDYEHTGIKYCMGLADVIHNRCNHQAMTRHCNKCLPAVKYPYPVQASDLTSAIWIRL